MPPLELERWLAAHAGRYPYDLSASGAPPVPLSELLALASDPEREDWERVSLGYGPSAGSAALRTAIAARYRAGANDRGGVDDVVATCGASEAIRLVVDALVRSGDEIVVQHPMYPAVEGLARARGAGVRRWRLLPEMGFRASLDDLETLLNERTTLVAITQPNGPTGSAFAEDELDGLVALLARRSLWLLSDEVYRDLALERVPPPSVAGRSERAIAVGDMAKAFGLGGLRVGWLIASDAALRASVDALRDYTTISIPTTSDVLARIALAHAHELVSRPLANARGNLELLARLAARDHVLRLVPPRAGVTAFPWAARADQLAHELRSDGVLVVPGSLFGCADHLRIGLADDPQAFAHAITCIERRI